MWMMTMMIMIMMMTTVANENVKCRLVLDYNEACTNEEDCQDWIVKIKVKNNLLNKGKKLFSNKVISEKFSFLRYGLDIAD